MHVDERLAVLNDHIVDSARRYVLLRGASLHAKLPIDSSCSHRNVSFVGRPFPLADADRYFAWLKTRGLTCLRLLVVWEALEHDGPGQYDLDYIEYVAQLVQKMQRMGLRCIIDAHQDLFSRLLGGSGSPGWTVELAGFDVTKLHDALAAHKQCQDLDHDRPSAWPSGYQKLATATMFTLFFGGDEFAPCLRIATATHADPQYAFGERSNQSDIGIGSFLQLSMIAAYRKLSERLAPFPNLVGIEPMNEPHPGYIGLHSFYSWSEKTDLAYCHFPSAFQGMVLGSGLATKVPFYKRSFPSPTSISHYETISPLSSVWREGKNCIWQKENVWTFDEQKKQPVVMQLSYFNRHPATKEPIDFYRQFWFPFVKRFADTIHSSSPDLASWLIFAGGIPNEFAPNWPIKLRPKNLVYAPHFYDLYTLFCRRFGNITFNVQDLSRGHNPLSAIYVGRRGVNRNYRKQTGNLKSQALPNYFSEIGTTFEANLPIYDDMASRSALSSRRHPSTKWQTRQMEALLNAMDAHACGYALWVFNVDNDAVSSLQLGPKGDKWNGEDFSFVFRSREGELRSRCMDAIERPYPLAIGGDKPTFSWNLETLDFHIRFQGHDDAPISRKTLIFLPRRLYGSPAILDIPTMVGCMSWQYDEEEQILTLTHSGRLPHYIVDIGVHSSSEKARRIRERPPDIDIAWSTWTYPTLALVGLVYVGWLGIQMHSS